MGLEVHVELGTKTKMFCGCSTELGQDANTQTCPTCLGLPGALPVVNAIGVESAIKIGLALNCEIAEWCRFARKITTTVKAGTLSMSQAGDAVNLSAVDFGKGGASDGALRSVTVKDFRGGPAGHRAAHPRRVRR